MEDAGEALESYCFQGGAHQQRAQQRDHRADEKGEKGRRDEPDILDTAPRILHRHLGGLEDNPEPEDKDGQARENICFAQLIFFKHGQGSFG